MMISLTGNKGFTLVEVIIAVSILSLGVVFIFHILLHSLDILEYCSQLLWGSIWAQEKMWQEESLLKVKRYPKSLDSGSFTIDRTSYLWRFWSYLGSGSASLYKLNLTLYTTKGKRLGLFSKYAYLKEEESK